MVIDSHTHLLPQRLARKVRDYFDHYMIPEGEEIDIGLAYSLDYDELLDRHAAAGITAIWNLPYAHKPGMAAQLNETMLVVAGQFTDHEVQIVTGCTVHPADPDPAGDLTDAANAGARVLKLHCSVGDFELDDPGLTSVLDAAGALGLPVVVHAGHAVDGHTDAEELGPIGRAVTAHRDTTFILAHCGHTASTSALEMLEEHRNLCVDLTPVIFDAVPLTATDANRFSDRILFGTDAPNTGFDAADLLRAIADLRLPEAAFQAITGENARRLTERTA